MQRRLERPSRLKPLLRSGKYAEAARIYKQILAPDKFDAKANLRVLQSQLMNILAVKHPDGFVKETASKVWEKLKARSNPFLLGALPHQFLTK